MDGSRCFEILGIDVMIDQQLKPWLIEVNHLPSFATDSSLDYEIKSRVIQQTINALRVRAADRSAYICPRSPGALRPGDRCVPKIPSPWKTLPRDRA